MAAKDSDTLIALFDPALCQYQTAWEGKGERRGSTPILKVQIGVATAEEMKMGWPQPCRSALSDVWLTAVAACHLNPSSLVGPLDKREADEMVHGFCVELDTGSVHVH